MAIDLRRGLEVRLRRAASMLGVEYHKARLRRLAHRGAGRRLRSALGREVRFSVQFDQDIPFAHDAVLERDGPGLRVRLSPHDIVGERRLVERIATYGFWLLACGPGVHAISVTLSDGDRPSGATFSPSSFLPDVTLLPDPDYFTTWGYHRERAAAAERDVPWRQRSDTLVWRGSMNSHDSFDPAVAMARPSMAAQRLLACLALRGVANTDVRFVDPGRKDTAPAAFIPWEIGGERVSQATWIGRKFALDIDGYTNAWGNLFTRLLLGCCVLKVESRQGYRQWYYDHLEPWVTHIPVAADLTDLAEKFDWALTHEAECEEIAARGRALAQTLDIGAVTGDAVARISRNWQRKRDLP
jgi:hypothetical protein